MPERLETRQDDIDPPAWWDDAEHLVVITHGLHGTHRETGVPWEYEPGEAYPHPEDTHEEVTPEMWVQGSVSSKCAALDENYERLDRPTTIERLSDDMDAAGAITKYRRARGVTFRTVVEREFTCEECGKTFETQSGLDGHSQVHRSPDEEAAAADESGTGEDATEDPADADEGEDGDEGGPVRTRGDDLLTGGDD